ncbi:hypothetical protein [Streptomyces tsukubensis]|uniref:Uncharacterized protein n=1 Tax=Streptomyces tsukubensis TaxID=83656 RepID=A0A1V4AEG7_9ACTN|nr:hypothetical protein [Streptomyces tsukubensis]OON81945.1 hypothetical protein B1H18_06390 [Streptomyces tsukubensis]QFR96531.1 hypothetical protein GBW32_30250 [Streptomyces tsukubensis]
MNDAERLPRLSELSERQIRGAACVWCAADLVAGQDVDLGEQRCLWLSYKASWFPRACPHCAEQHNEVPPRHRLAP